MLRVPLKIIKYRGRIVSVPPFKPVIVRGKKVLIPLRKGEPPTLDVMPYWNKRIDNNGKTVTIKKSNFRIPIRVGKKPPSGLRPVFGQGKRPPKYTIQPFYGERKQPSIEKIKSTKRRVKPVLTRNQKNFVLWIRKFNPKLYRAALLRANKKHGLSGIGDFFGDLLGNLTDLAPKYLQFKQQKDLMKMQLKRAQEGLPPAKVEDYAPVIKTRIDLAPATRTAMVGGIKDIMMPLAIGGGVLLLVLAMKKRR